MRIGSLIKNQYSALPEGSSSGSSSSPGASDGAPRRCPGSLPVPAWISMAAIPLPPMSRTPQDGSQGSDTQPPQPPHIAPLAMLMSASSKHMRRLPSSILPRGRVSTVLPSSCTATDPRWQARLAKKTLSVVQVAAAVTAGRLMVQEWKAPRSPHEHQQGALPQGSTAQQQSQGSSAEQQQQQQPKGWGWLHKAAMDATAHIQSRAAGDSEIKEAGERSKQAAALYEQGLRLEAAIDVPGARKCFEDAAALDPTNAAILCRLSKTWTDLSYAPGYPEDKIPAANRKAIEIAHQVIHLDPDNALGHIAACVSMGRLALYSDNKTKVKLAHDAREEAVIALALDPNNDISHHIMGRWHYEMAGINSVVRLVIRMMYGTALQTGSHKDAADCYRRAAELRPDRLIHHVELGRCLLKMGMLNEAKAKFEAGLTLNCEDINAHTTKRDAQQLLHEVSLQLGTPSGAAPSNYSYI